MDSKHGHPTKRAPSVQQRSCARRGSCRRDIGPRTTEAAHARIVVDLSRGDVEPLAALAVALHALGAEAVVSAPGDQDYWAARVAALGIGAAHDGPSPTFESLSAVLSSALTIEASTRATTVAGMIRTDGAAVASKLLLETH